MRFFCPSPTICLLAFLGAFTPGQAMIDAGEIPALRLERLNLNNGRKLSDVLIQSYDATTNRFFVVFDNTATVISAELVPLTTREQIKSAVRRTDSAPAREPIARPLSPAPRLQSAANAPAANRDSEPTENGAALAAHRAAALAHAERFYRFEFRAGSNQVSVTALDFDLSDPDPIPGWPGRCRTTGRAFLEFFDSRGNSFQRATSAFEVITEQKPGEPLTVESFARRN